MIDNQPKGERKDSSISHAPAFPGTEAMLGVLSSVAPRSTGLIKPCRRMIRLGGGTGNAVH
jgi:hypothetical protein